MGIFDMKCMRDTKAMHKHEIMMQTQITSLLEKVAIVRDAYLIVVDPYVGVLHYWQKHRYKIQFMVLAMKIFTMLLILELLMVKKLSPLSHKNKHRKWNYKPFYHFEHHNYDANVTKTKGKTYINACQQKKSTKWFEGYNIDSYQ